MPPKRRGSAWSIMWYPRGEVLDAALEMAEMINENAPLALAQAKFAIDYGMETDLATGLMIETKAYEALIPDQGSPGRPGGLQGKAETHLPGGMTERGGEPCKNPRSKNGRSRPRGSSGAVPRNTMRSWRNRTSCLSGADWSSSSMGMSNGRTGCLPMPWPTASPRTGW